MSDCTVFGIPHSLDSVVFTKFSFGLFGLHIAAFCWGVNDDTDDDVLLLCWPYATRKLQNPVIVTIVAAKTIDMDIALKHAPFLIVMVLVNEPQMDIKAPTHLEASNIFINAYALKKRANE